MIKPPQVMPPPDATPTAPAPGAKHRTGATYPFRKGPVLLACDGREQSDGSLIAARLIAARLGVAFEVVTVLEPLPIYSTDDSDELSVLAELDLRPIREARVRHQVETWVPPGEPWLLHVRYGSFTREIAAVARERAASLVVVGSAPHNRLGTIVAGTRAAQLLRILDCPVLSAAPEFTGIPSHVVVATDFAPPSIRAAEAMMDLLGAGATLTLVHVVPLIERWLTDSAGLMASARSHAQVSMSKLRAALASRAPAGMKIGTEIMEGTVELEFIDYVRKHHVGIVAVGTHGSGVLERLLGSSAATILHGASYSVLACPPPPVGDRARLWLQATDTVTLARQDEWGGLLAEVSKRNAGRTASLEIDDPEVGAQMQAVGLRLAGAAYDPHDGRVELMLGNAPNAPNAPHSTQHLTHTIGGVKTVALLRAPDGRDRALEIHQQHGSAILTFDLE